MAAPMPQDGVIFETLRGWLLSRRINRPAMLEIRGWPNSIKTGAGQGLPFACWFLLNGRSRKTKGAGGFAVSANTREKPMEHRRERRSRFQL